MERLDDETLNKLLDQLKQTLGRFTDGQLVGLANLVSISTVDETNRTSLLSTMSLLPDSAQTDAILFAAAFGLLAASRDRLSSLPVLKVGT